MSSWDFIPKTWLYARGSWRLCLLSLYVHEIDVYTEILFALVNMF